MSENRRTVGAAFQKIEDHERVCSERYAMIFAWLKGIVGGMCALVLSLVTWMAVQLYNLEPLRIAAAQQQTARPAAAPLAPTP